ncbi:MAG: M23 family metallopeptidase [Myxococcaceae bacterium]|nr:M23 family metallopeptidase [Myxococcaceae bacterium]
MPALAATLGAGREHRPECKPRLERYPVAGRHNNGYDPHWSNFQCSPEGDSESNSDFSKGRDSHLGNDIFAFEGTPVVAVTEGYIRKSAWDPIGGKVVIIEDACGWWYYYGHLSTVNPALVEGNQVAPGTFLGTVGNSGAARNVAPHLHFSLFPSGNYRRGIDPYKLLTGEEDEACEASLVLTR